VKFIAQRSRQQAKNGRRDGDGAIEAAEEACCPEIVCTDSMR